MTTCIGTSELPLSYHNYRIDSHLVIKITDYGLSKYFRQGTTEEVVKVSVKSMAPESLSDDHFPEKSDVVP